MKNSNHAPQLYLILICSAFGSFITSIIFVLWLCNTLNISIFNQNSLISLIFNENNIKQLIVFIIFYILELGLFRLAIYSYCYFTKKNIKDIENSPFIDYLLISIPFILLCLISLDYFLFTAVFSLLSFIIIFIDFSLNKINP